MRAAGRETESTHFLWRDVFVKGPGHNNITLTVNFILKLLKGLWRFYWKFTLLFHKMFTILILQQSQN